MRSRPLFVIVFVASVVLFLALPRSPRDGERPVVVRSGRLRPPVAAPHTPTGRRWAAQLHGITRADWPSTPRWREDECFARCFDARACCLVRLSAEDARVRKGAGEVDSSYSFALLSPQPQGASHWQQDCCLEVFHASINRVQATVAHASGDVTKRFYRNSWRQPGRQPRRTRQRRLWTRDGL